MVSNVIHLIHDFLFWLLNAKENYEAGNICFELKIPRKKRENYDGMLPGDIIFECNFLKYLAPL